jgi:uncharacterized membrane protein YidH (DUF202 family)
MYNYEPATPRTALGAIAFALTLVTFGLFVAGPAALAANGNPGEYGTTSAAMTADGIALDAVRTLPAVEVVGSRNLQG